MITEDTTIGALEARLREAGVDYVRLTETGRGEWTATVYGDGDGVGDAGASGTGGSIATAIDRALCVLRGGT